MLNRLPRFKEIVSAYAVIAFIIQAWSLNVIFRQLPSWSNFLNINEILAVCAYRIAESFMECLFVLGILLLLSFALPSGVFRDVFVVRGTAFAAFFLGSIILFWKRFENDPGVMMADYTRFWTITTILLAILSSYASAKVGAVSDFLYWVSDRMIVFLYFLIPLSLAGTITVFVRMIIL